MYTQRPHSVWFVVSSVLVLFVPIILLIVFLHEYGGIPRIAPGLRVIEREAIAGHIQIRQLLLLVPAVILFSIGLGRLPHLVPFLRGWTWTIESSVIMRIPRPAFLAIVVGLAVISSALLSSLYLSRIPQIIDAHNYYFQAKIFASQRLTVPSEPYMQDFFNFIGIMDTDGRRYASSFPGHPFMLMLGEFFGLAWLINPLHGGLIVLFVYGLGRITCGETTGRIAAILALFSPFRIAQCSLFMAHPTTALWILIFVYALVSYDRGQSMRMLLLMGLSGAFVYLVRPQSAFPVLIPFGLFFLYQLFWKRRYRFTHALIVAVLIGASILTGFLYNRALTGSFFVSPRDIVAPSLRPGFGDSVGRPLPDGTFSGHSFMNGMRNTVENVRLFFRESMGWGGIGIVLFILGIFWKGGHWLFVLIPFSGLCLIGLFFTYPINSPLFGPRYYFEWLPLYLLCLSRGLVLSEEWLMQYSKRNVDSAWMTFFSPWRTTILLIACALVFFMPAHIDRYYTEIGPNRLASLQDGFPGEKVIVFVKGDYFDYGSMFAMNDPLLKKRVLFAADRGKDLNIRLKAVFPDRSFYHFDNGRTSRYEFDPGAFGD